MCRRVRNKAALRLAILLGKRVAPLSTCHLSHSALSLSGGPARCYGFMMTCLRGGLEAVHQTSALATLDFCSHRKGTPQLQTQKAVGWSRKFVVVIP
ncbi:hypothetical protein B0T19DRAFT_75656 [Cercophora scortea]|uniref:Uncharacterized protein n=1 Tax=Cercophora scortea TaxID=314031 RepID=A0AAE0J5T7_9PEZI|nr:hypothetical protein B0T19DRAFT_75656 [Cercophora scortea]